ncbi:C-type lectin domain family 1 member A-like [Protopterus annectens]|uniref:C-type lectin domain family 1 member A-like n=1 Tax=Protopterus annectens TaxID=7888 RepID=UPI001CF933F7|nr:C-type lectin domain family 1 member A-like [Protopterus annectens]
MSEKLGKESRESKSIYNRQKALQKTGAHLKKSTDWKYIMIPCLVIFFLKVIQFVGILMLFYFSQEYTHEEIIEQLPHKYTENRSVESMECECNKSNTNWLTGVLSDLNERSCLRSKTTGTGLRMHCCPEGWKLHQESCYYFSYENLERDASKKYCIIKNASLAVILTEKELIFITEVTRKSYYLSNQKIYYYYPYWIGIKQEGDTWKWEDGTPWNTSLCAIDTYLMGSCAVITNQKVYSRRCSDKLHWICEMAAIKIER